TKVMESVRTADQAVVSLRVTEAQSPAGGTREVREKRLREEFARRIASVLTPMSKPIVIPPDVVITPPPPPVGDQLLAFVEMPSDAPAPHFDIQYWFELKEDGAYRVSSRVEVRVNIEDKPIATSEFVLPGTYTPDQADAALASLMTMIVAEMTGSQ